MQTDVSNRTIVVNAMGEAAFDLLSPDGIWRVLASVSRAIYLTNAQNELLWLAESAIPLHRRGLQIHGPIPRPPVGVEYQAVDGVLTAESEEVIYYGGSPIWRPPFSSPVYAVPLPALPGLVLETYQHFLDWPKPAGLAGLIPSILNSVAHRNRRGDMEGIGEAAAEYWPMIRGLVQAGISSDFHFLKLNALQWIGLGPGLTPSGDDFLGGFFFALHKLGQTYPDLSKIKNWNYSDFIIENKSRTHIISYTFLKDHAAGFAMEPLHAFANGLLAGHPIEQNLQYALRLVTVGHSTGWDLLTGFLAGMAVIFA
jgi:hypothetical protein